MQKDDIVRIIRAESPDVFLQKARKRGWICPECRNGEGKDGDGIVLNKKTESYKCFRCGFNGDILDLIGKTFNLPDFKDQLDKAVEIYGLTQNFSPSAQQQTVNIIKNIGISQHSADMSDYFAKCHAALKDTSYFTGRGSSQELLDRFNIGYDASFTDNGKLKKPMQAVIFPTSTQTFEARNIAVISGGAGFRYYKHGSALEQEKEKPVFIVEGIIDALFVMEAGGQAIGLSSADNYRLLLTELDKIVPAKPLILCFDNDDTGADFQQKLADELDKRHISFLQVSKDIIRDYHDPNDRLVKDTDGLKNAVISVHEKASTMPDTAEKAKSDYLKTSAGKSLSALLETITANAKKPRFSTGFKTIDDALNGGLYTGLYFIGAISSLGKTTHTLQIADNLDKQGRDVLFFSLEQSKYDLMTKSVSRETFLRYN